jgi:hypothetical protein
MVVGKSVAHAHTDLHYWVVATVVGAGILYGLLYFAANSLVDVIPPNIWTEMIIHNTFVRIDQYAAKHKSLPPSLDVLPKLGNQINQTTDAWGQPLQYSVANGIITLRSPGKGGTSGASGISVSYYATHADGSLWVGTQPDWIVQANVYDCPRPSMPPRYGIWHPVDSDIDFANVPSHIFEVHRDPNEYQAWFCR